MPNPRFQVAVGPVDGANKQFETSVDYVAESLAVFRNGVLLERSRDNGWVELGTNKFEMKIAPKALDVVHCFYMDTLPSEGIAVEVEVEKIYATLAEMESMVGTVGGVDLLSGVVEPAGGMLGVVVDFGEILGVVEDQTMIHGYMKECV